jgi:O-antigen/teichoic acid export membrane protein
MIYKIKPSGSEPDSFKNALSKTFKYGSFLGLTDLIDRLWKEAQLQGIGFFKSSSAVTGYNISLNYQKISDYSIISFQFPLLTSLTTLNTQENYEQASFVYRIAYKITLFLLLIISGILFFSVEFILDFLFLEDRLIYSNYLRLIVLASIFKILAIFLQSHLNAQRKVKLSLILRIFYTSISIPLFFFGLFLYGIEGAIIYGLILGNLLSMTIQIYATYRFGKVNLNIKKILSQYLTFFIPLGITIILKELLFKHITLDFTQFFGLSLLKNLDLLSTISFLLFFLAMNIILKTVTSSDITLFESYFKKERFIDKFILKLLNFLKKFTRN